MDFRAFAEDNRLKIRRDEDNTRIIPGKVGHLWEYGEGRLAVTLLDLTPKKWGHRRRLCLSVGMELQQDGDWEGTLLFDPTSPAQVEIALKVASVKRKRVMSPAQLEVLARAREASPIMRRRACGELEGRGAPGRASGEGSGPSEEKDAAA